MEKIMNISKFWLTSFLLSPVLLGASLLANVAIAAEPDNGQLPSAQAPSAGVESTPTPSAGVMPQPNAGRNRSMTQIVPVSQLENSGSEPPSLQPLRSPNRGRSQGQVTSVSQLSDVQPTDWAFQALQSLVERYGCIVGYPDSTFRGNRALSRYEFAAGLNACMTRIEELIAATTAPLATKEDLAIVQKLQEEFAAELAGIRGVVDTLESRTAKLEAQQFSTTTKLGGEIIFAAAGVLGEDRALNSDLWRRIDADQRVDQQSPGGLPPGTRVTGAPRPGRVVDVPDVSDNTIFAQRTRLNFDASTNGKDRLRVRLQGANVTSFAANTITNTNLSRLGFDGAGSGAIAPNDVQIHRLEYRFPVGNRTTFFIEANEGEYNDNMYVFNPLLESSARGAISRFGRFNPIYRLGSGQGFTVDYKILDRQQKLTLSAGYLTGAGADPRDQRGLFDGSHAALAQLRWQPLNQLDVGFTYVRGYFVNGQGAAGGTGTSFANNPFGSNGVLTGATGNRLGNIPTTSNNFGLQFSARVLPKFVVSGWAGYSEYFAKRTVNAVGGQGTALDPAVQSGDKASGYNWALTLAFPDIVKEGDVAGLIVGQPPRITESDFGRSGPTTLTKNRRVDEDETWHIEGFYRFAVNNNIDITPGVIAIINPEGNSNNDPIFVGTIRTTFRF
jgi:hypothetical protein